MKLKFYRDEYSLPRVEVPNSYQALGTFLEGDLQGGFEASKSLLELIEKVQKGRLEKHESTGNAHTLTLSKNGVHIFNEFAIPVSECSLTLNEFYSAVKQWHQFTSTKIIS